MMNVQDLLKLLKTRSIQGIVEFGCLYDNYYINEVSFANGYCIMFLDTEASGKNMKFKELFHELIIHKHQNEWAVIAYCDEDDRRFVPRSVGNVNGMIHIFSEEI